MNHTNNRIVWLFREPRSGSTSAAEIIASKLNRKWHFIDHDFKNPDIFNLKKIPIFFQKDEDYTTLLHTHYFKALLSMKNYDNPILIRLSRKNTLEQCLSRVACDLMNWNFTNLRNDSNINDNNYVFKEFCNYKISVRKEHVDFYAKRRIEQDRLWKQFSCNYENQTLYYEEILEPVDIPVLGLYNVSLILNTKQLPSYKKEVFVNYDEVNQWLKDYNL